jgi:thiamine transport system permease protein
MACRDERVTGGPIAALARATDRRIVAGLAALGAIGLLVGGAFAGLLVAGAAALPAAIASFDAYLLRVAAFTLWQAALSTILAVAPALFVARALSRHPSFPGRGLILRLFAIPLALPAIVAAMGLLALLGHSGYFAGTLAALFGGRWEGIYGLSGILIAHVFFNLPLATRFFLAALEAVPADQWRLAGQLGLGPVSAFRFIEWPALRRALPGVAGLVFMLCLTSFTIVLMLGGGPAATTLEVAIYQALRFDFDPVRAVALTIGQIGLTAAGLWLLGLAGANPAPYEAAIAVSPRRYLTQGAAAAGLDAAVIALATIFVLAPLAAILLAGLDADLGRLFAEASLHRAALTSFAFAAVSGILAVAMALALISAATAARRLASGSTASLLRAGFDFAGSYVLVVPPIVIGAGWFVLLLNVTDVFLAAPLMVISINAVMAMPFVIRAIRPACESAAERHDRLAAQLDIRGWNRLRLIDWPAIRTPLLTGFAFAMALSLGDLGVIALFGSDAVKTLPYLLYERMGSYRTADAAGISLIIALACLALMAVGDRAARTSP